MDLPGDLQPVYMTPATAAWVVDQLRKIETLGAGENVEISQSNAGIVIDAFASETARRTGGGLLAKITATGTGEKVGLQSFELLHYDDQGRPGAYVPAQTVDFAARERNGTLAPIDSVVRVEFAGLIENTTAPIYVYDRTPAPMHVKLTGDGASDGFYRAVEVFTTPKNRPSSR